MNHLKMSVYYTTIPKKKLEHAVTGQTGPMQISYAQLKRQKQQNNDVFLPLLSIDFKGCVTRKYWVVTKVGKETNE